jgi:ATP-dependent Zn protease
MIRPPRGAARLAAAIIAVLCLALPAAAVAAEEGIAYTNISLPAWEAKLKDRQIESVTLNKFLRTLRTTLKDGSHVLAKYPKKQEKVFLAKLEAAHVPVNVLTSTQAKKETKKKPAKHKIRYIVGGVVIVLIVIGVIVLLLRRRRVAD